MAHDRGRRQWSVSRRPSAARHPTPPRRAALVVLLGLTAGVDAQSTSPDRPDRRFHDAAEAMRRLAESWGDQPYGAVLVLGERIVGEGPSRVVLHADATAHAEREAIRDAQRRLQRTRLDGAVLYSTSRPCAACEAAAAAAGVARMVFGAALSDAGAPRAR
jgi:tRNA(adenine34) deaminase